MKKLLIIEDEEAISMALEDDFRLEGYDVMVARDGKTGLQLGMDHNFDLILLDVMLPEMTGLEVCKALRRNGLDTPIIMLTAKSQEIDKILGLELGADDYVTKPFSPHELQARVRALLRRSESRSNADGKGILQFGDVRIDFDGHQVLKNGDDVGLTALEFDLLKYFLENDAKVLSRDEILDAVWNEDVLVEPRTVDSHVAHLRRKIEADPAHPRWIIGVRGIGYKFVLR
jgi:DNA-binding response OmpR family regulator